MFPKFECRLPSKEIRWELTRYNFCTPLFHTKRCAKAFINRNPMKKVAFFMSCRHARYKSEEIAPTGCLAILWPPRNMQFLSFWGTQDYNFGHFWKARTILILKLSLLLIFDKNLPQLCSLETGNQNLKLTFLRGHKKSSYPQTIIS